MKEQAEMTVKPERGTGEIGTRPSESEWFGQLWQELSTETRAEIERRAKANGFTLIELFPIGSATHVIAESG